MWTISFILLLTSASQAQELPESVQTDIQGVRHQCFDLGGYTTLLRLSVERDTAIQQVALLQSANDGFEQAITLLEETLSLQDHQIQALQEERVRLTEQWAQENKLRLEAENRPRIGSWVAWGFAAAGAIVAVTLILVMVLGGS